MDTSSIISIIVGVVGLTLSIWSIWYARQQTKINQDIRRNEMISLWAHLDRIRTLFSQIQYITDDDRFHETGTLNAVQKQILPKIHKGLADEYVRIVELIVKKTPVISIQTIDNWEELGRLKSEWQKQQFLNLIPTLSEE